MPPRVFATCEVCTHAAMVREGAPCGLCGGATTPREAPPDLFTGWRCICHQCSSTPC